MCGLYRRVVSPRAISESGILSIGICSNSTPVVQPSGYVFQSESTMTKRGDQSKDRLKFALTCDDNVGGFVIERDFRGPSTRRSPHLSVGWTSEERQEVVALLRESGLSQRAIAAATGLSKGAIQNTLNGREQNCPSEPVTGTDGKTYAPARRHEPIPMRADRDERFNMKLSSVGPTHVPFCCVSMRGTHGLATPHG